MSLLLAAVLAPQAAPPRAVDGFAIEKVSPSEVSFPMFAAFDDKGRLFVTESSGGDLYLELQKLTRSCKVRLLEDKDGDGTFETSKIFAEGLTPSMGLAWRGGKLYVADPPDLAVLEDRDGDGRADKRTVILTGFGHQDNGSLHGIVFGPDGLLYMTTGRPDGYALRRADGTVLSGKSGALLRCRPDGSGIEVLSRGFENLVEVAFLPGGDIVGTCNWYQRPVGGIRDAIVHLLDGGLYPYAADQGTPLPVTGEFIPPLALFPAVALSGLARCEGTAFPAAYRGNLFTAQHNSRKVQRHVLERSGSSYRSTDLEFVWSEDPDFHPSDVLMAPDGSMLVVDTGGWYVQHCPTGKIRNSRAPGGIYRVRWTGPPPGGAPPPPVDSGTVRDLEAPALVKLLATGQRLAAAEALARRGTAESLPAIWEAIADDPDPHLEHALVHAAHRIADAKALQAALAHESPRVQKAALILLDQPPRGGVAQDAVVARITAKDAGLRQMALRLLQRHPDWAKEALTLVRGWVDKETLTDEEKAGLRSSILAFQANGELQALLGAAIEKAPPVRTAFLLETLAQSSLSKLPGPWKTGLERSLAHADADVRLHAVRAVAVLGLADFDARLAELGARAAEAPAIRLEALRATVARRSALDAESAGFLVEQLGGEALPRLAAAEVLRRATLDNAALARILKAIRSDALISPSLFLPAIRGAGAGVIEEAAASIRAGWRPGETELGPLLEKLPADARDLILKAGDEQRARLAQFEPLLKGGNPARGREVFFGRKVACGGCHPVGAQGGRVGPDLTKVGAIRAGRDLLESILVPSSTFAQGYESYVLRTASGEVLTGLIARQGADTLVLRDAAGAELQLRKDRIQEMKRAEKSVMPEGLERALAPDEFRDLLAFLQSLK